jgi:hypothetical protein
VADAAAVDRRVEQVPEGGDPELDLVHAGVRFTWPDTAKMRVPLEFSAPRAANAAAPLVRIHGRFDSVSTLLTMVGWR